MAAKFAPDFRKLATDQGSDQSIDGGLTRPSFSCSSDGATLQRRMTSPVTPHPRFLKTHAIPPETIAFTPRERFGVALTLGPLSPLLDSRLDLLSRCCPSPSIAVPAHHRHRYDARFEHAYKVCPYFPHRGNIFDLCMCFYDVRVDR